MNETTEYGYFIVRNVVHIPNAGIAHKINLLVGGQARWHSFFRCTSRYEDRLLIGITTPKRNPHFKIHLNHVCRKLTCK